MKQRDGARRRVIGVRAMGRVVGAAALAVGLAACAPAAGTSDAGDAGTGPSGCRSDRECSTRGLVCDRSTGQCVQCTSAADCTSGQQCMRGTCAAVVPCTSSRMCPNQVCNTGRGFCVDCVTEVDCQPSELCQDSRCVPRPTPCMSDRECSTTGKVCDTGIGQCVECVRDTDCTDGTFCSAEQRCQRQVCMPMTRSCAGDTLRRECNGQGTAFVETACGAGERCASGMCIPVEMPDVVVMPDAMDATAPDVVVGPDVTEPPPDVFVPPPDVFVPPDAPMAATCPAPGDMRIPSGQPYQSFALTAASFLGAATGVTWSIEAGNACDQLSIATVGKGTFTINGAATTASSGDSIRFRPTLSGNYRVTVSGMVSGATQRCSFDVRVSAPGFRVEMCRTPNLDLDLWLHDPRNMNPWNGGGSPDTCAYANCRNTTTRLDWGYMPVTGSICNEPTMGVCYSPRLEYDVISDAEQAEVIAVDAPRVGDTFRVGVNYYSAGGTSGSAPASPMVLVHCGGVLRATYGGATVAGRSIGATPVSGFVSGGGTNMGTLWRVADVTMSSATDCTVTPLVPTTTGTGYCVDTSTDRSFNGPCRR